MKKKYLLLIGMLAVCCMLGGCKKKEDVATVSVAEEPTIITKEDSVSDQVVEIQQGSSIDKSQIKNVMGLQTATSNDLVITNLTGGEISAFYARSSDEEDWGNDYIEGEFTLKNNDRALFYYEKDAQSSSGTIITKYDLCVSFADDSNTDCFFRELTLSDIEELSLYIDDGVPYVKYQSLSTKQQVSTLSDARKRMGLEEISSNSTGTSSSQVAGSSRTGSNTGTNTNTNTNTDVSSSDPSSSQPSDTNSETEGDGTGTTDPGSQIIDDDGGDVIPPGLTDQGQDIRDTAQDYVGQDMDSLIGEIGTASATEYGTDEATGDTIVYHYYDGFAVSTTEDENGEQTVTGIW